MNKPHSDIQFGQKRSVYKDIIPLFLLFLIVLPFQAKSAALIYAKPISSDAIALKNAQSGPDPTYQFNRAVRVCNLGDTATAATDDLEITFQWDVNDAVDCNRGLMFLSETGPDPLSTTIPPDLPETVQSIGSTKPIASLPACSSTPGTNCDPSYFWDWLDTEDLDGGVAGGDPWAVPDYCYDMYYTVEINPDESDSRDSAGICSNFGGIGQAGTGAPRRDYHFQIDYTSGTTDVSFSTEEDRCGFDNVTGVFYYQCGDGVDHNMRAFQTNIPGSVGIAIKSIANIDGTYFVEDPDPGDLDTPLVAFNTGETYDVVFYAYNQDGQVLMDFGANFDAQHFQVLSVLTSYEPTKTNNKKTDITYVPYRQNATYFAFCDQEFDATDPFYGGCKFNGSGLRKGHYINDAALPALKTASAGDGKKFMDAGIIITMRILVLDSAASPLTPYIIVNAGGGSAEWKKQVGLTWEIQPTYSSISDFKVEEISGDTVVQWTTDVEIGTVGFHLLRKERTAKEFDHLNTELLLANPSAKGGSTYSFIDATAQSGQSYSYKVIEVDAWGNNNSYGPFPVTVAKTSGKGGGPKKGFQRKARLLSKKEKALNRAARDARKASKAMKKKRVGNVAKLFVSEAGLYELTTKEIGDLLSLTPNKVKNRIKTGHLRLTNQGRVAPLMVGSDGVYFYGVGIDTLYTTDNVYWLSADKGSWMEYPGSATDSIVDPDPQASFPRTIVAEENLTYMPYYYTDPDDDYWLWKSLYSSPSSGNRSATFPITVFDPASGNGKATLKLTLQGAASYDHHAMIAVKGTTIGDVVWSGRDSKNVEIVFDSSLLQNGDNTITVTALWDNGKTYFFTDQFELTYPSLYHAVDDSLAFTGNGNPVVQVMGFNSPDVIVLDVTDSTYPVEIPVHISDAGDGTFSVTMTPTSPERRYHAIGNVHTVAEAYPDVPSKLQTAQGANYLIIGPSELLAASEDLAKLRESNGMSTMIVDLEDVFDEFNYGIYSPVAIRDFLRYAVASWIVKPEYVLLVGSASVDYKDYLGYGDNLMPSKVASTPYGLFDSDNYFADINGDDGIPEIAIGRIPARTSAELTAYINKIKASNTVTGGQWSKQVLMLSDNTDDGGNFADSSNVVAAQLPGNYSVQNINLPDSTTSARQQVIDTINNGVGIVNYFGHGAYNNLASSKLLHSNDKSSLSNSPTLPIMSFMTCSAGWFGLAGWRTLAEELTLDEDGGASAVWTASGASLNNLATSLGKEYFRAAFQQGAPTIGKAILNAKAAYGEDRFMLDIYNLMGDPALPIQ